MVLLGDVLELLELPLQDAFEQARPFFEELGEAVPGRPVVLVPGNHDHRLAEPLLDRLAVESKPLGLEHRTLPAGKGVARLAGWLGTAELELAYPGIWLRDDVYATHGHYMDCYRRLPRLECVAAAALIRALGPLPERTAPRDYEEVLSPIYSVAFGLAQARLAHRVLHSSERVWRGISNGAGSARRARGAVLRGCLSVGVRGVNRLLQAEISADLSADTLSETGIAAAAELASRLEIDAAHVLTGHTHRAGPASEERAWRLAGGAHLHNTGSWIFTSAFHDLGERATPYLPGTVTWLNEAGPPRRVNLLAEHTLDDLHSVADRLALSA